MQNPFETKGLNIDQMVSLITYEKEIVLFLEDIKADYRIQRAMWEDENNILLTGTRIIDDIVSRLSQLEPARKEYFAKIKEEEDNKKEEENS